MSQNATPATLTPMLNPGQTQALAVLLGGGTVTLAAERAGVATETVHRWLWEPLFLAELNGAKAEMMAQVRADLRATAIEAAKFLRESMVSDFSNKTLKLKVSLAVLRMVGADAPETIGSTDPAEIALARRHDEAALSERELVSGLFATIRQPERRALR